jgi:hypothetical protein
MPKRFNPFTGTLDYYSNSDYTGDLRDSTTTKIADVVSGEITDVEFTQIIETGTPIGLLLSLTYTT